MAGVLQPAGEAMQIKHYHLNIKPYPGAGARGGALGGGSSAESALAWNEFAAADAADWDNFNDDGERPSREMCDV